MNVSTQYLHGRVRLRQLKWLVVSLLMTACISSGSNPFVLSAVAGSTPKNSRVCNSPSSPGFSLDSHSSTEPKVSAITTQGWSRVKLDFIPTSERSSRSDRGYPSVKVPKGTFGVEGHGLPRSVFCQNGDAMSAGELASIIIDDSGYQSGMTVYLMCCETGKGRRSFAQQLANALGTEVVAPTEKLWPQQNGTYIVARERKHDAFDIWNGEHMADTGRLGEMKTFKPGRRSPGQTVTAHVDSSTRDPKSVAASSNPVQEIPKKQSLTGMAKTASLLAELHRQRTSTAYVNTKAR